MSTAICNIYRAYSLLNNVSNQMSEAYHNRISPVNYSGTLKLDSNHSNRTQRTSLNTRARRQVDVWWHCWRQLVMNSSVMTFWCRLRRRRRNDMRRRRSTCQRTKHEWQTRDRRAKTRWHIGVVEITATMWPLIVRNWRSRCLGRTTVMRHRLTCCE